MARMTSRNNGEGKRMENLFMFTIQGGRIDREVKFYFLNIF